MSSHDDIVTTVLGCRVRASPSSPAEVSEARRWPAVARLHEAASACGSVLLACAFPDADYNRTGLTFVADEPASLADAVRSVASTGGQNDKNCVASPSETTLSARKYQFYSSKRREAINPSLFHALERRSAQLWLREDAWDSRAW